MKKREFKISTQGVKFCLLKNKGFSKLLKRVERKFGEVKSILSRLISSYFVSSENLSHEIKFDFLGLAS